jgi:outer membrane protein OmpA-like peptidoglycan-associated protein
VSSAPENTQSVDYFRLAAAAVRGLDPGPADLLRFERLRLQLAGRGIRPDDERIPLWIAPALCRSAEAQARFLEAFPSRPDAGKDATRAGAKAGAGAKADDDSGEDGKSRPGRKQIAEIAGGIAIALILIASLLYFRSGSTESGGGNGSIFFDSPQPRPVVRPPVIGQIGWGFDWWAMASLVLPPIAALLYVLWQRRRRQAIRRDSAPEPHKSVPLAFAEGLANLFDGPRMRQALRKLRRHRAVSSPKLNVAASIRQTIAAGGMPVLRFGVRPRSPDYVVMSEREAPGDHLTILSRLLCNRLAEEQVAHTQYEFFGDPRRLQKIVRGAPADMVPLATALARQNDARHLLFMEGYDCFAGDSVPYWLDGIAETERPAMLDPRPGESWGRAEDRIQSAGLAIFPISESGLAGYGDFAGGTTRPPQWSFGRPDLPEALAADRDRLLGNDEPPDLLASELVADLDAWLDSGAIYWLRALALFPYVDPALTVHLGTALRDGAAPLMDEQRFLRLARLPWMRAGRMPDWLRRELVRGLTPAQLGEAVAAIQAYLLPVETPAQGMTIDLARGSDKALRKRLLEWLKLSPQSVLSERILIDALSGLPPERLGVEAPSALVRRVRALWQSQALRAALAAVSAMIAITVWQWPMMDPSARSVTAPAPPAPTPPEPTPGPTPVPDPPVPAPPNPGPATNEMVTNTSGGGRVGEGPAPPIPTPSCCTIQEKLEGTRYSNIGPWIVYFDWQKDEIRPASAAILDNLASSYLTARQALIDGGENRGRQLLLRIQAHTDRELSPAAALQLTQRQAINVRDYLAGRGVPAEAMIMEAFGQTDPLVEPARGVREPQNRRVEIIGWMVSGGWQQEMQRQQQQLPRQQQRPVQQGPTGR